MFHAAINWISDLLWPRTCLGCARAGSRLCASCASTMREEVPVFRSGTLCVYAAGSMHHELLARAVWHLKYRNARDLAEPLGALITHRLSLTAHRDAYLIVPVPLHRGRLRERGYNQAALLARRLATVSMMPIDESSLVRTRPTAPQVKTTSRRQRQENMQDAFRCQRPDAIKEKDVILVDDVCTTGATLQAAARALHAAGARSVIGATVARG